MLFSRSFGSAEAHPETVINLLAIRDDTAYLGVESFLGTRTPTDDKGRTRSFPVRTRIQPGALHPDWHEDIVTDLVQVLCIEPCQAIEPDRSGGWQVVPTLPPRLFDWKPPDPFDLVDWAARNRLALAVPFPAYSDITSFPVTPIPGLTGNWIVLKLN